MALTTAIILVVPAICESTQKVISTRGMVAYPSVLTQLYVEGIAIRNENGPLFLLGCNIRGQAYDPQTDGRYDDWYTYRVLDAANIKSYGFNTVRLLVYWECVEISKSSREFVYDNAYIEKIRQTIEAYNQQGIYVIVCLNEHSSVNVLGNFVPTLGNDADFADAFYSDTSSTSAREHLKCLWLKLSEAFKDNAGVAGYDICNEPHRSVGSSSDQQIADFWFEMAGYVIHALRTVNDNHIVFVNFSPWARYAGFMTKRLEDNNVVYEPHFYYGIDTNDLTVSNNDQNWLKQQFDTYIGNVMSELDAPFACGEQGFGGNKVNLDDARDIWLENTLNVSRANPLMQGWLYFCYVAYNGVIQGGGWQNTLKVH